MSKMQRDRVFELRIYQAAPGKLGALEARFREVTSRILARHNLEVVGYWTTPKGDSGLSDSFVFLVAHGSRDEAASRWAAVRTDREFLEVMTAEQTEKLVTRADTTFMEPTDFSPLR